MIVSLFDYSGVVIWPWVAAGKPAVIADIQHPAGFSVENSKLMRVGGDLREQESEILEMLVGEQVNLLCAFPPCTDLAVSGALRFAGKAAADHAYRDKAMDLVLIGDRMGKALRCPYFIENPVSVLSTIWRKPDFTFHPFEYGGYLQPGDTHPDWPQYIAPRDAYMKTTNLWTGGGFTMPLKRPVPLLDRGTLQRFMAALGGKSLRTKNIRSATPRGFARALFEHYGECK